LKKFLFSTTALAVAGAFAFSGGANAAEKIKIGVGGFMNSEMGFGSNQGSFESDGGTILTKRDSFNTVQDSEIYFSGTTKLDSGVSVSVTVQLEADQTGGIIDESYMKLTGGFGDLRLGYVTGAASTLKHTAPFVGMNLTFGGSDNYISVPAAVTSGNSTHVSSSGDAAKISYISPVSGGLRIGAAYTPSTTASNLAPAIGGTAGNETQVYEAVLSFEQKIGTSSVQADVAYEHSSGNAVNTHDMVRAGVKIAAGGFTVGGSMSRKDDVGDPNLANGLGKNNTTSTDEIQAYDLGVSYTMGDYTFGVAMASGEQQTAAASEDSEDKWSVGASYGGLGGGVTLTATYINADYTDGQGNAVAANNNNGHALIGQVKVSF
jgi:outer membrane protein OmpU